MSFARWTLALALVGAPLVGLAQEAPAPAQQPAPAAQPASNTEGVEEILVTINKREENIQDVGGTIAAFGDDTISKANIENVGDLMALLPNVEVKSEDTDLSIRGVARAAFDSQSPVAYHVNGVYHFNSLGYIGQFYDLENVQVALGPSGSLYGRNANGGAIDVQWKRPIEDWQVVADTMWAPRFDNWQFRTAVNVPLSGVDNDLLNARFALLREVEDGTLENLDDSERNSFNAKDDWTVRGILRSEPTENLVLELRGRYTKNDRRYAGGVSLFPKGTVPTGVLPLGPGLNLPYDWANGFQQFRGIMAFVLSPTPGVPLPDPTVQFLLLNGIPGVLPPLVRDPQFFTPLPLSRWNGSKKEVHSRIQDLGSGELEMWDVDGTAEYSLQDLPFLGNVDLIVLGGLGEIDNEGLSDSDFTEYGALDTVSSQEPEKRRTVEVRMQSNNESWLNWTLGFFYVRNTIEQVRDTLTPLTISGATLSQEDKGYAPFANVTIAPEEIPIEMFFGVRWNHDEFERSEDPNPTPFDPIAAPFPNLKDTFEQTTFDVGLKWFVTDHHMLYAKYARGYKAGFTQVLPAQGPTFPAIAQQVQPENIDAEEIGAKTSWLDGRLNVNVSAFHYNYKDLQVPIIQFTQIVNTNADKATVWGVEIGVDAVLFDGWSNRLALGWLSAKFDEFCANDPLVNLVLVPPPPDPACAAKQVGLDPQQAQIVGGSDLTGRRLEDSPEWKLSFLSSYTFELGDWGSLTPALEFGWTDKYYRRAFNNPDVDVVSSFTKTDVRIRWDESQHRYWVELFGENLEDNYVYPRGIVVALTGTAQGFGLLEPRSMGVRVGFNWGGGS